MMHKYRPISLMPQVQKTYGRCLLSQATYTLDQDISEHQAGFRRSRQTTETVFALQKVLESHHEWSENITVVKLDLAKAFDRIHQSAVLTTLQKSNLHKQIVFALTRETIGAKMSPELFGCKPADDICLERGTKQGSPESGILFAATIDRQIQTLKPLWSAREDGCNIGTATRLSHLLFVDDLISARICKHLCLGSVCPFRFVP